MKFIACIGSRVLFPEERELCFNIGKSLVQKGYGIKSGNAIGADQSYVAGANSVNPQLVYLYLPYPKYNREKIVPGNYFLDKPDPGWFKIAAKYHPYWNGLGQGKRKLHARNVGIVDAVEYVIAFPNKEGGGGTVMGMRVAIGNGIKVYNLREGGIDCLREVL